MRTEHLYGGDKNTDEPAFDIVYLLLGRKRTTAKERAQLWSKSKAWYLKGFCLTRQDMRLFKPSCVRGLTVTGEAFAERHLFTISPNPSPEEHRKQDATIVLKIPPEMTRRVLDEFGEVEQQSDGSFIVAVTWPEDEWVYGSIMSFGEYIEVLEPECVREMVKTSGSKPRKIFII